MPASFRLKAGRLDKRARRRIKAGTGLLEAFRRDKPDRLSRLTGRAKDGMHEDGPRLNATLLSRHTVAVKSACGRVEDPNGESAPLSVNLSLFFWPFKRR